MLDVALTVRRDGFVLDAGFASRHQRVAIVGPSRAGKTLALRCIAGVAPLDRGHVVIGDTALYDSRRRIDVRPWRRRIALVPSWYGLLPHLSVAANIAYGLAKVWRGRERTRVDTLLAVVGLDGVGDRRPADLSPAEQQRVALAQALAGDPSLLLLDDPFASADVLAREQLRVDLLTLLDAFETPMIYVTRDFDEAYLLGETVVVLTAGRVAQVGMPAEISARPRTATVARLVGATNVVTGRVIGRSDDEVEVEAGLLRIWAAAKQYPVGSSATFAVRCGDIRVVDPGPGRPNVTVSRVLRRNGGTTVILAAGDTMLEAAVSGPAPTPGTVVGIEIAPGAAHVVVPDEAATGALGAGFADVE
ncbi:MAG TPA: ABC transporter ATP-binding protein [bacterium]|nr:ABC transporter ATP-binding protein [bacterium]